jgi:hypothetical protein
MSTPENILARWSRRKLESARERETSPARAFPEASVAGTKPSSTEAESGAPSDRNAPAAQAFDPASLPPIESIAASTDIRAFLQSGVPAALTRSALRRAWVTDPAIRDFIGIAENQWDFNDPAAIPGFGPLRADQVARLAESMLDSFDSADNTIERIAEACAPSPRQAIERTPGAGQHDGPAGDDDARR